MVVYDDHVDTEAYAKQAKGLRSVQIWVSNRHMHRECRSKQLFHDSKGLMCSSKCFFH